MSIQWRTVSKSIILRVQSKKNIHFGNPPSSLSLSFCLMSSFFSYLLPSHTPIHTFCPTTNKCVVYTFQNSNYRSVELLHSIPSQTRLEISMEERTKERENDRNTHKSRTDRAERQENFATQVAFWPLLFCSVAMTTLP